MSPEASSPREARLRVSDPANFQTFHSHLEAVKAVRAKYYRPPARSISRGPKPFCRTIRAKTSDPGRADSGPCSRRENRCPESEFDVALGHVNERWCWESHRQRAQEADQVTRRPVRPAGNEGRAGRAEGGETSPGVRSVRAAAQKARPTMRAR